MRRVFLSYKSEDRPFVLQLRSTLLSWGYSVWMDVFDIPGIAPGGVRWAHEIDEGLRSSDIVLGVLSPGAVQSENVTNEWDWAIVNKKPFLLFLQEPCKIPTPYSAIQYIDAVGQKLSQGIQRLQHLLATQRAVDTSAIDPYHDYLQELYRRVNDRLSRMIIAGLSNDAREREPIHLGSRSAPDMVDFLFQDRPTITTHFAGVTTVAGAQVAEFEDFAAAFKQYGGKVLLLGEPGAGKTVTLLQFGRAAVVKRLQDPTQPLPILSDVAYWDPESNSALSDWIAGPPSALANGQWVIQAGNALILLDGLDELGSERKDRKTHETYDPRLKYLDALRELSFSDNGIVVTCRLADFQQIHRRIGMNGAVVLEPLDDTRMHDYLKTQPQLLGAIASDANLRELLRTPLLLSYLAFAYENMTVAERSELSHLNDAHELRHRIFQRYVESRYEHEASRRNSSLPFSLDEVQTILRDAFVSDSIYEVKVREAAPAYMFDRVKPSKNEFLDLVQTLNLLLPGESDELLARTSYRFVHLYLRDFIVYPALLQRLRAPDPNLQAYAAEKLGELRDKRAIPELVKLLENETHLQEPDVHEYYYFGESELRVCDIAAKSIRMIEGSESLPGVVAGAKEDKMTSSEEEANLDQRKEMRKSPGWRPWRRRA